MMHARISFRIVTAILVTLFAPRQPVLALGTESFGNAPAVAQPGWAAGIVDVVNLQSRVYSHWVNGNENFYYRGDAQALSAALRQFAAVKAQMREVIVLPGAGKAHSFHHKPIDFDWKLHVPSGIYRSVAKKKHAVMTLYIGALKPRPVDDKQVKSWLTDLASETFKTREHAGQDLRKLGNDARPHLRAALKAKPPIDVQRRIEDLLARLRPYDVSDLDIPKGLTMLTVDDLLAAGLEDLKDPGRQARSFAVQELQPLAAYSDKVVPALVEAFKNDKDDHVRRIAAACLAGAGSAAKTAEGTLREGLNDPDASIRDACQRGLDNIAKCANQAEEEARLRRELAIIAEIGELKKARR